MLRCEAPATAWDDEVPYCQEHNWRRREYDDPLYRPPHGRRASNPMVPPGVRFLMGQYVKHKRNGSEVSPAEQWGMVRYNRLIHASKSSAG